MKVFFLALALLVAIAVSASAQVTTLAVDIEQANFTWEWVQGTGGPADEFRIKCGPTSGNYATTYTVPDPSLRSIPVKDVVGTSGNYFCVVSAANAFGESGVSNEVFFDAGTIPVGPTNLKVTVQ